MAKVCIVYLSRPASFLRTHEGQALLAVARAVARLTGCEYRGSVQATAMSPEASYFVPDETLVADEAARLGIRSARDLFGGVVPREFVRTKAITHGLVGARAARPPGWSERFAARVRGAVLPGFTAFGRADARRAAEILLGEGPVRIKRPLAAGGRGQAIVAAIDGLERVLGEVTDPEFARAGIVLETNLSEARTVSVGHVAIGDLVLTYHGQQRITTNNAGHAVYGGSDLLCVRGGWDALERLDLPPQLRRAIGQARRYDEATDEYPGLIASRRNYDVAQGVDARGRWRSGVLEQGWRVGGASGAEVLALEALAREPSLQVVHASAVERYGAGVEAPRGADVHFAGEDPEAGPMVRYAMVVDAQAAAA
jgi:hypothetical protein